MIPTLNRPTPGLIEAYPSASQLTLESPNCRQGLSLVLADMACTTDATWNVGRLRPEGDVSEGGDSRITVGDVRSEVGYPLGLCRSWKTARAAVEENHLVGM